MIQPNKDNAIVPEEQVGTPVTKQQAAEFTQREATQQQEFGLDTSNTNRADFWESIEPAQFGESKHDTQKLTLEDTPETIEQHRYENQTKWDKTANSIGRTVAGVGLKLIDGIAFTGAMVQNGVEGTFDVTGASENIVSKSMQGLEQVIDQALPIYKPVNYDKLGFYDKIMNTNGSFFFDEGAEAFEFVGSTALSTYLGSGLINAGLRTARLAATTLGNANKVKKGADLLSKSSKVFGAAEVGDAVNKAKTLSVFGEAQAPIYKTLNDAAGTFVKNNVLTKETALNIYNTAVEAGMEGHEVAKQYLDSVESETNARLTKEYSDKASKIQGAVGVSDQEKKQLLQDLQLDQSKEKDDILSKASVEAKRRANNTFFLNAAALYGPNMIQTKALLGSIGSGRTGIQKFGQDLAEVRTNIQKVKPSYFAETGKSFARNYPSELGQEVIQKGITDYQLESHPDTAKSYLESGVDQVKGSIVKAVKGLATQEIAETALITALITAPTVFIDASHRTKAAAGETKAMTTLLDNADKAYTNYRSDVKSVYKTGANGKVLTDGNNQPIIDQDVIDRNVYGQVADFATALETSDAILNNDETRLNLVRGRALATLAHDYASMGENGRDLALMVIDDKAKEASDAGDQEEARYLQGQKKYVEAYIDAYHKIDKSEGNSIDLFEPSNDKEESVAAREFVFHKKYKKSLYHQVATRLNIQNAIAENNRKITEIGNDDPSANKKLADENEKLGEALKQSFAISNNIKNNYDKLKNAYYKQVDTSLKIQKEITKINDTVKALEAERATATPERQVEIDALIQENKNKALGASQILNQNAKYSGINQSAIEEDVVRQPFSNIEGTSPAFDYAEKNVARAKFLDNKYKILQAQYNDAKQNGLIQEQNNLKEQLEDLAKKIPAAQEQAAAYQDQINGLSEKVNSGSLEGAEKDQVDQAYAQAQRGLADVSASIDDMLDTQYKAQDKLYTIEAINPITKKVFHDYEDLRQFAEDFQKQNKDNFNNSLLKADIDSIVEDYGQDAIGDNPIETYEDILEKIRLGDISEDGIIKELKGSLEGFQKFEELASEMPDPEVYTNSFDDIQRIANNIQTLVQYAAKAKEDTKFNIPSNKLSDLFVQLEHEQLLDITEDYSIKGLNNKDFVDLAGLNTLKDSLVGSIESLKHPSREELAASPAYQQFKNSEGITARLEKSLATVNNLIHIAKENIAAKEARQNAVRHDYSSKQVDQINTEGSPLPVVLQRFLPEYQTILDADPINGVAVLWEKVRKSNNKEFIKQIKEAVAYNRDIDRYKTSHFYTPGGELNREVLREAYGLDNASDLPNIRFSSDIAGILSLAPLYSHLRNKEALDAIDKAIDTDYTFTTALGGELATVEGSALAPSPEQVISIRELLMALTSDNKNVNFLQGSAGTGKSSIVIPTVLKVAKKLGVITSDDQVYSFGHTQRSSENIAQVTSGVLGSTKEFLEMTPEEFDKYSVIVIDEFPMMDYNAYTKKIDEIVKHKPSIKIIALGDYNQNVAGTTSELSTQRAGKKFNFIHPLTIRYRSNNESINNLSDFFENTKKKITKVSGTATGPIGTSGIQGSIVTNRLQDLQVQINADADNTSKVVVIASYFPQEVEAYKRMFDGSGIEVLSTEEAQGITVERVYTIASQVPNNTAIYTAISRASHFSMLYMPTLEEFQNFTNPSDTSYLEAAQRERDIQLKATRENYNQQVSELAELADRFGITANVKADPIDVTPTGEIVPEEDIEIAEDETYDAPVEGNNPITSKGGITVTWPESSPLKSRSLKQGDEVILTEGDKGPEGYRITAKSTGALLGFISRADLPSSVLKTLERGPATLEVNESAYTNYLYKTGTDAFGYNLVEDKIEDFINGIYREEEEKPSVADVLKKAKFSVVMNSRNPEGYAKGSIELTMKLPRHGEHSMNFNQITTKNYKNSIVETRVKLVQDFTDKVIKLNEFLTDNAQYGTSAFTTLVKAASSNLEIEEGNVKDKTVPMSSEEFQEAFQSLSEETYDKTPLNQTLKFAKDLEDVMYIATEIAKLTYGPRNSKINFSDIAQADAAGNIDINNLKGYQKKKYDLYAREKYSNGNKLNKEGFFVDKEGKPVEIETLELGEGPAQKAFSSIVKTSQRFLEKGGLKYTYIANVGDKSLLTGLPLLSTNQSLVNIMSDFASVSLGHLTNLLNVHNTVGLKIPLTVAEVNKANDSIEAKIELGKKLTSNFIGVTPGALTLRMPGIAEKNIIVTTPAETQETITPKTGGLTNNISNLLDNSDNFTCD